MITGVRERIEQVPLDKPETAAAASVYLKILYFDQSLSW